MIEAVDGPIYRGAKMFVPDGGDIIDLCRKGIGLEAAGYTSETAAAALGLAINGYRICRQIVFLADCDILSANDKAIAANARDVLASTLQWARAWEMLEPVSVKFWGTAYRVGGLSVIANKRLDRFENTFAIIMQACMTTDEVEVPYLSAERVQRADLEITRAQKALRAFAARLKEIHE